MKNQDATVIAEEVRQLCAQYLQEVPSRRRTWPKSIKDRVFQLSQLELSSADIAVQTGIPVATIYSWKSAKLATGAFMPVKVVPNRTAEPKVKELIEVAAKVPKRRYRKGVAPTITVVAPNGLRFEGLDAPTALKIAARFGIGS